MTHDFSAEYSQRNDDELLELASDRKSLTPEAATALDAELSRRKLTHTDERKHQKSVEHHEQREGQKRRRKVFGTRSDRRSWAEVLPALVVIALIIVTYFALPSRYQFKPDMEEAAADVMISSVVLVFISRGLWHKIAFWMSLLISSMIHFEVVHAWVQRVGTFSRSEGKLAALLGFVLFGLVYGFVWFLQRNLYGSEADPSA